MTAPLTHFRFDGLGRIASLPFLVRPANSYVTISGAHLVVRFGPWVVVTPLENITGVDVTGPYAPYKVLGPPRLSLADRGLTFGTNTAKGVCLRFAEPVRGADPFGWIRHPGLTVTVEDPEALVGEIEAALDELDRLDVAEDDEVEGKTTSELRAIAKELGIARTSSMRKQELVEVVEAALDDPESRVAADLAEQELRQPEHHGSGG